MSRFHQVPQAELPQRGYRVQLSERRGNLVFWVKAPTAQAAADKVAKILDKPLSYALPTNREHSQWQVYNRKEGDDWGTHHHFRPLEMQPKPKDGDAK